MFKATKEQIAEWKEKHKKVFCIKVDDKACYLKKPSRQALGYSVIAGKDNPIKANEVLLNDCWLGGDEDIKTDDDLFFAVSRRITELIEAKEAELEKL